MMIFIIINGVKCRKTLSYKYLTKEEAKQRLRVLRGERMDELNACKKRVDQMGRLIPEKEKGGTA